MVAHHLAATGRMPPTAFVETTPPPERAITMLDASGLPDPADFRQVVRGLGVLHASLRTGVAFDSFSIRHDDPDELARIHEKIAVDPDLITRHPLSKRGISITIESDEGFLLSFHEVRRLHPEMAELLPADVTYTPRGPETPSDAGFHVPTRERTTFEARSACDMAMGMVRRIDMDDTDVPPPS